MPVRPLVFRNRYVLLADVVVIAVAAWCAFALRFGWLFMSSRGEFRIFLPTAILVKVAVFYGVGLYRRFWRYASFWDLMAVVVANTLGSLVVGAVLVGIRLAEIIPGLSRSVFPIDWLLALALTTGLRASVRVLAETMSVSVSPAGRRARRILVAGAGDAGALVVREMQRNPQLGMVPVAFVDDERAKIGKRIYGVPVVGACDEIGRLAASEAIDEVVIAIPRAGGAAIRAVAERCHRHNVPSKVMPGVYELLDGSFGVSRLRDVQISDLLRRPQVSPTTGAAYLSDSVVLITGAGGSIGSELCRQVANVAPHLLVLLGHGENSIFQIAAELRTRFPAVPIETVVADVRDQARMAKVFQAARPDVVFHAAAHKHVPLMESNIGEAVVNNVVGTRNVVASAVATGTPRLVLISTDKAVAPSSVMGASKRVAEMIVRAAARRERRSYVVVRFGNVLGSRGSVVPLFKEQIERGGPVTVTHPDVRRYFMTIPEAVHLVLQAGGMGRGGELFVLDMGEPVRLKDLAADMIRLSGFEPEEVPIVFTGLRPGEKLDEQLWEQGSRIEPTMQPDIRLVDEHESMADDRLAAYVDRLVEAAGEDDGRVLATLQDGIPTAQLTAALDVRPHRSAAPQLRLLSSADER